MVSPLVLLASLLNPHGGYVKSDNYLLQFLFHMTSDVKSLHIFFIYFLFVQKIQHSMNKNYLGYLKNINLFWNLFCSKGKVSIEMKQWANIFK